MGMMTATPAPISRDLFKGWLVLVVDDEPENTQVAAYILKRHGAEVIVANDGREALKLVHEKRPKLIISDLAMPYMDGWALIAQLKDDRSTADIPVLALTASGMGGLREKAIAAGFHNCMTKPFTMSTFVRDLVRLLVDLPDFQVALD